MKENENEGKGSDEAFFFLVLFFRILLDSSEESGSEFNFERDLWGCFNNLVLLPQHKFMQDFLMETVR